MEAKELQNGGKIEPQESNGGIMGIQGVQNGSLWSLLLPLGERSSQASAASERAERRTCTQDFKTTLLTLTGFPFICES